MRRYPAYPPTPCAAPGFLPALPGPYRNPPVDAPSLPGCSMRRRYPACLPTLATAPGSLHTKAWLCYALPELKPAPRRHLAPQFWRDYAPRSALDWPPPAG